MGCPTLVVSRGGGCLLEALLGCLATLAILPLLLGAVELATLKLAGGDVGGDISDKPALEPLKERAFHGRGYP